MKGTDGAALRAMRRMAEHRNEKLTGGELWRTWDLLLTMLAVVVFALAIRGVLVEPVRVDGDSMLDTLRNSDYMFVEKVTYAFTTPQRGDVIICYYPDEYYEETGKTYHTRVKRVVAVEGDTVQTIDGRLYVNGQAVSEPYLSSQRKKTIGIETARMIGKGEIYVLGDNRIVSNDSRNTLVGAIPLERVVGKAHFVVFPISHFHGV